MVEVTLAQVTRYLITYGPKLYTLLHKQQDRLGVLEGKIDELFLREIRSAFAIIDSIATLESAAMRDRHLYQAEGVLLKNIVLDKGKSFGGEPGSFWVSKSYFGLSIIAHLREEHDDASKHLLRAFQVDPRQARKDLAPEFFAEFIAPHCAEILEWKSRELAKVPDYDRQRRKLEEERTWVNIKGAGLMAGAGALALLGPRHQAVLAVSRANSDRERKVAALTSEINALPTTYSIEREAEQKIDQRCQEVATQILAGPKPTAET